MYISLNRKLMTCILRLCNSTMTQIAMVNHIVCILFLITFTTALRTKQMSFCGRILHRYYASNIRNIRQNQFFDKMRVVCTDLFLSHILCHMWQKHNMFQFYVQERRKLPKPGWANGNVGAQSTPSFWDRVNWSSRTWVGNFLPYPPISYVPDVDVQYCNLLHQPLLQHKAALDYFVFQNVVQTNRNELMNDIWMGSEWSLTSKTRTYVTYLVWFKKSIKPLLKKKS